MDRFGNGADQSAMMLPLSDLDVLSLEALGAFLDFELNRLAFL
jgi:hypothetical protein